MLIRVGCRGLGSWTTARRRLSFPLPQKFNLSLRLWVNRSRQASYRRGDKPGDGFEMVRRVLLGPEPSSQAKVCAVEPVPRPRMGSERFVTFP